MLLIDKVRIFDHLLEQHTDEAAYLWSQRAFAVNQVHQPRSFICKQEQRIINHLRGLLIAPGYSWDIALQAAKDGSQGELFVLASLAFRQGDPRKQDEVLILAEENPASFPGLASALAWLPDNNIHPFLRAWIGSENAWLRYLSLTTCSLRRLDPRSHLTSILHTATHIPNDPSVIRALRLSGELKRSDLLPLIQTLPLEEGTTAHYWGHWSRLLMGDDGAFAAFEPWLLQNSPHQISAIQLAIRSRPAQTHLPWLKKLAQSADQIPQLLIALAALGDPQYMGWLLERMAEPRYATLAGFAFSQITGVDLVDAALIMDGTQEEEEFDMDTPTGYEQLPKPNPALISQYWKRHGTGYETGQCYLWGQIKSREWLENLLCNGLQGQRQAAALVLALTDRQRIYPNIKQPEIIQP